MNNSPPAPSSRVTSQIKPHQPITPRSVFHGAHELKIDQSQAKIIRICPNLKAAATASEILPQRYTRSATSPFVAFKLCTTAAGDRPSCPLACDSATPMPTLRRRVRSSTLVPRKKLPVVGDVVDVLWDDRDTYFRATLARRCSKEGFRFLVAYSDGDCKVHDLAEEYWRYADGTEFEPGELDGSSVPIQDSSETELEPHASSTCASSEGRYMNFAMRDLPVKLRIKMGIVKDSTWKGRRAGSLKRGQEWDRSCLVETSPGSLCSYEDGQKVDGLEETSAKDKASDSVVGIRAPDEQYSTSAHSQGGMSFHSLDDLRPEDLVHVPVKQPTRKRSVKRKSRAIRVERARRRGKKAAIGRDQA